MNDINREQNSQIFEAYKPLRNHLRQTNLQDSLYVLWGYMQHLQFNNPIPPGIETHLEIIYAKDKVGKTFYEWELEVLIKETIINAQKNNLGLKTLRRWNYFAGAVNKLKSLENEIAKTIDKTKVLTEIHRIAHRQFPWWLKPNKGYITRYFKIFGYPSLNNMIKNNIGLTTQELYLIGMAFLGAYLRNFALFYPLDVISIPGLSQENFDKFKSCFSCNLPELKEKLLNEQQISEKFVYSYSSLRKYPLIETMYKNKRGLICPSLTLLVKRIASGIFYKVRHEKYFGNEFGKSFQSYIGEVIKAVVKDAKIYPEEEYYDGKDRKDTIDWIINEESSALFIECKAKRMTLPAKTEIKSEEDLEKDLDFMANFITQTYKSIGDYLDNKYPSFKFKKGRKIFPLIITLEEWYLFGDKLLGDLKSKVEKKMRENNLPLTWLLEMPYSVCSIEEFEIMIQIIGQVGIKKFMEKKVYDQDKEKWSFFPFLKNEFPEEYKSAKFLFPTDFNKIFPEQILRRLK